MEAKIFGGRSGWGSETKRAALLLFFLFVQAGDLYFLAAPWVSLEAAFSGKK